MCYICKVIQKMAINLSFINNLIMTKKYNFSKGWSLIDQMTDNSQLVVYNGQTVTKAQKRAMKAAQTRTDYFHGRKQQKKKRILELYKR